MIIISGFIHHIKNFALKICIKHSKHAYSLKSDVLRTDHFFNLITGTAVHLQLMAVEGPP